MAGNRKISELVPLGGLQVDPETDVVAIVDVSNEETKKISISALRTSLLSDIYDIAVFLPGFPPPDRLLAGIMIPRTVTFPANFGDSRAMAEGPAAASTVLKIKRSGIEVGTLTFGIGQTGGSFSGSAVTFAPGTRLEIHGPAALDMTLRDISITLKGTRAS